MTTSIAGLSRSIAASLGSTGFSDEAGIGEASHAVLCLIDGLGWHQLAEYAHIAPSLHSLTGPSCLAAFPSTTPVGLASIGTGLDAGRHGFVGASFLLPETGHILSPLHWGSEPSPVAVQPERTVFETLARDGVRVSTIGPQAYVDSGLTRAVLRGADYRAAEDISQRITWTVSAWREAPRSLSYVYWPHLDRLGHEFGVGSQPWLDGLAAVDELVCRLVEAVAARPDDAVLVVTSDHGMVNTSASDRIDIESIARLREDVRHIAGEPRMRHIYCRDGSAGEVKERWGEVLGERATVMSRAQVIASGLLGDMDPVLADRVGDVVVVARGSTVLASRVDPRVSQLIGQHGADTDEEMLVPALIYRGGENLLAG